MTFEEQPASELLEQVMAGVLDAADPIFVDACRRDPNLRLQWQALQAMEDQLRVDAGEARDVLREAQSMEPLPGEESFKRGLEQELRARSHGGPKPRWGRARKWLPWALAASVLAMSSLWMRGGNEAVEVREPSVLGGIEDHYPTGEVAKYSVFRWNLERPDDGYFTLEVMDAEALDSPLIAVDHLKQAHWTYDPQVSPALPGRIVWRVFTVQGGLPTGARAQGEAWLASGD